MNAEERLLREIFEASPTERLQAAIDKLEQLRAESTPGTWRTRTDQLGYIEVRSYFDNEFNGNTHIAEVHHGEPNAELIVTLHRTIDAQLAILAYGLTLAGPVPDGIVALADAILGGAS